MRVILKTGGKSIEKIVEDSIGDPQQMNLSKEEAEIVKAYLDRFNDCRVDLNGDGYLEGWDEDFFNEGRIKEAFYLLEQDPMFGTYVDDREGFDRDWAEGEYQPDAGIRFRECDYIIDTETPKEKYKRLLRMFPGVKVINEISNQEAAGVNDIEVVNCHIYEYVLQDGQYLFKGMARSYVNALVYNSNAKTESEYEQERKAAWEIVNGLKWQVAIFLELKAEG